MALGAKVVLTAEDRTANAFRSVQRNTNKLQGGFSRLKGVIGGLVGAAGVGLLAKQFFDLADKSNRLRNRLKLVEDNAKALDKSYNDLFGIAQRTHTDFESAVGIYFRFSKALGDSGATSNELKNITLTLSQAISLSGVSADSANAAMTQLGQGLAAGALRGEELNSVLEQTPRVAQAIAEGMGVTIGQLRKLGAEGKITAKAVMEALKNQGEAVSTEFKKMTPTVEMSMTNLTNAFGKFIDVVDESLGVSEKFNKVLKSTTEIVVDMTKVAEGADLEERWNNAVKILLVKREEKKIAEENLQQQIEGSVLDAVALNAIKQMLQAEVDIAEKARKTAQALVNKIHIEKIGVKQAEKKSKLMELEAIHAKEALKIAEVSNFFNDNSKKLFESLFHTQFDILALRNEENRLTAETNKIFEGKLDMEFQQATNQQKYIEGLKMEVDLLNQATVEGPFARAGRAVGDFGKKFGGDIMAAGGASGARAKGIMEATMRGKTPEEMLANGMMELILSNEKVQEGLTNVFDALFKLVDPIIDLLVPVLDAVAEILVEMKPLFEILIPPIKNLIPPIVTLAKIMTALVQEIVNLKNIIESFDPFAEQDPGNITASPGTWFTKQTGWDGFQHGGVSSGGPTLVGESGPELVNLPTGARVTPNNQMGGMGIVVNIFDGTGRKIDQSMSDLRVEIIDRANRFSQFSAVAA